VEQRTDFEKLIMEVITDGTIHPEEAVKQASRILIQHLMIITDENITFDTKEDKKEDLVDEQTLQLRKYAENTAGRPGSFCTCVQLPESC
jgi:DNA-directed RNA polymerase subunit alpha